MANEARGLLYETITDAALNRAIKISGVKGPVRWNEKPDKMTVNPDFTIGENPNAPTHIFLITASGAARNSEIKSWRNLAELQEAKAQLPTTPIVVNVYYKSELKQGIAAAAEFGYDTIFHADKKAYYKTLESWVSNNIRSSAKTKEKRRDLLQDDIAVNPILASAIEELAKDLAETLKIRNNELEPLWQLMKTDFAKTRTYPTHKITSLRRGLAKLAVIEPNFREIIYEAEKTRKAIPTAKLPQYVFDLSFFTRSIAGSRLTDNDIKGVINLLGAENCEAILKRLPSNTNFYIVPLRDIGRVEKHADFVFDNYEKFTDKDQFKQLLLESFDNPSKLSGIASDEKVWVFDIVISLLKAQSKRLQGYGSAQLADDTQIPELLAGLHGVTMTPFVQREKHLSDVNIDLLAAGLSKRFAEDVSKADIPKLKTKLLQIIVKENLEDRLIPYRNLEASLWLLEEELKRQKKAYSEKSARVGWLNEYSNMGRSVATTPFVKVGGTLIHWKSVSDAGKDHKKKELSARARNVKYQYDAKTKTFKRREGVERLALIVDGTFNDNDLKVLSDSGWDLIVYPDEISDLVSKL